YSTRTCSTAAFKATSSSRFFGSPTAALPGPGSDPPPAFAASCSHPAVASLPAPGSHPCRRTLPSRHRSCASIPPLLSPCPPPCAQPPTASALRSSVIPCACSSTFLFPFPSSEIILSFVPKEGIRSAGWWATDRRKRKKARMATHRGGILDRRSQLGLVNCLACAG